MPRTRAAFAWLMTCMLLATGCHARGNARGVHSAPAALLGTFVDDYNSQHRIDASRWRQGTRTVYDIVAWHVDSQYAIARNGASNPADGGRWTRIDWMELRDMAPYTWAFCLSAYNAPSGEAAERTRIAQRGAPRTGCNGFPFTRMRVLEAPPRL